MKFLILFYLRVSIIGELQMFFKKQESLNLFLDFYELSYKKDPAHLLLLIQTLQYIVKLDAIPFFDSTSLNRFMKISLKIFKEKNTLIKNSISLSLIQLFNSFTLYVFSPINKNNENHKQSQECYRTIIADIILQLEEKSRNILSDNQIFIERLYLKLVYTVFKTCDTKIGNSEQIEYLIQNNFSNYLKQKFKQMNTQVTLTDIHYLLIGCFYMIKIVNKLDFLLLVQELQKQHNNLKQLDVLIKIFYFEIFKNQKIQQRILDYNYLICLNLIQDLNYTDDIDTSNLSMEFNFQIPQPKLTLKNYNQGVINLLLNNLIDEQQTSNEDESIVNENLPLILHTLETTLHKFQPSKLTKLALSFRNNLLYNIYRLSGAINNKSHVKCTNEVIVFIYNEIQTYKNQDRKNFVKVQNLKTLLNIAVNMNTYLSIPEWKLTLKGFVVYGSQKNKIKSNDLDEFQILSNSFIGLFQSSTTFKTQVINYIIESCKELILQGSLQTISNNEILLKYLCTLIESNVNRIQQLWKSIHDLFLNLLEKQKSHALSFCMKLLTRLSNLFLKQILVKEYEKNSEQDSQIKKKEIDKDQEQNKQNEEQDKELKKAKDSYEQCLLLINIILNKKSSEIYFELFNLLESLIDQNGYELRIQDWHQFLIFIKQILIFHENKKLSDNFSKRVFELLQKLNANYLNSFDEKCIMDFIMILKNFIKVTDSKNYKYGVIEYFYTVSDYINKNYQKNQNLWLELFSFLNSNSHENDCEIRNTSLNIFAGIINNYGQFFSEQIWSDAMLKIYLKNFDDIIEIYFNLLREEIRIKNFPDTPSHILKLKDNFESQKKQNANANKKIVTHEDIQSISKQWQETIKILIQSFNRIFTKYLQYPNKKKQIQEKMFEKSFYLFRITSKSIFNEVTSVIKNIILSEQVEVKKKTTLLQEIDKWLSRNNNQGQAVHELMTILNDIFESKELINTKPNFQVILNIYSKIVFFSSFSEEYSTYFYNLDNMCKLFLTKIFTYVFLNEKHDDEICLQFINFLPEILNNNIKNEKSNQVSLNFIEIVCNQLYGKIQNIPIEHYDKLLNVLFSVKQKINDEEYQQIIKDPTKSTYFQLYKQIIPILKKNIEKGGQYLELVLNLALKNFYILNLNTKERNEKIEDFLNKENFLCQKIVNFYMNQQLENFVEFEKNDEIFFQFLMNYKQNFDKINSNKRFDPIKESEEMTFCLIIQNFQNYLKIKNSKLQQSIITYLQINFASCVKMISSLSIDSPRSFKELKKIFSIFTQFECDSNLALLISEQYEYKKEFNQKQQSKIHLLRNYNDVAQLISIETDFQTKAYMIEYFNQVQRNYLCFEQLR